MIGPDGPGDRGDRYGAFFSLGSDLKEIVSWDGLVNLNRFRDPDGRPDPDAWVASLDPATRLKVQQVLAS